MLLHQIIKEDTNGTKRTETYMDCKFPKSPMAGEISPPRFKLDRFLQTTNKRILNPSNMQNQILQQTIKGFSERERERTHKEATERVTLSQKTPRQEQKSSSWASFQSSNTLATLLNEALIDINAFPVHPNKIFQGN